MALLLSGCSRVDRSTVDRLNDKAYDYHYRNLDSTRYYARKALKLAGNYDDGYAEALNNLAFVALAHMDYDRVYQLIGNLNDVTDNEVELLVGDIQLMRLCQRQSRNKDFYDYRERALSRLRRIDEERDVLTPRQRLRMLYANSEFHIVESTYFYYVGLTRESVAALESTPHEDVLQQDTAQLINFYYNVGSGGIIHENSDEQTSQTEFEYLLRCYVLSMQMDYPFFEAQALQAMSEHLQGSNRQRLINDNLPAVQYVNSDRMPDSLLAGNLAQRAMQLFTKYGDVYQIAGSYRTLAECYWQLKDYRSSLICLQNALYKDTVIERAPDLVASIREQLSLAYSAIDDKPMSDYNRNIYLDMQEKTRQDRQLEAHADQLNRSSEQLNIMIAAVVLMILLVIVLLYVFDRMRRRSDKKYSIDTLLQPLQKWKEQNEAVLADFEERKEDIVEQTQVAQLHVLQNRKRNLEQRTKITLVNSVTPFIDRIINEARHLRDGHETPEVRQERFDYIGELTEKINEYNGVLTKWIQLRQGELSLRIESFALQPLFDLVGKGRMGFHLKGVELHIEPTDAVVKADNTLTLFMINTLADNARKFTPAGGEVSLYAREAKDYVEISVQDTGIGMTQEQMEHVFDHKPLTDESGELKEGKSHGFGLMNCKGIIDKYKKISQFFGVCAIGVDKPADRGCRFWFRLPKGVVRLLLAISLLTAPMYLSAQTKYKGAKAYADSTYYSNIHGTFQKTLLYADSCIQRLNSQCVAAGRKDVSLMTLNDPFNRQPAEITWFHKGLPLDYAVILRLRNEVAVAALALHKWDLYSYNNRAYTQLFRLRSADKSLPNYVYVMQKLEVNKNVAIILLVILLLLIFPAYYMLYYRHRLFYRFSIDLINHINGVLLSDMTPEKKLHDVDKIWSNRQHVVRGVRFAPLDALVEQIKEALQQSIEAKEQQTTNLELAEDELHRTLYENARLHVSNSVLDNCLSTLKHETMYYPSRIRQLIDDKPTDLKVLSEVVDYYKALYSLLSEQAMRQTEGNIKVDRDLLKYLMELLQKLGHGSDFQYKATDRDANYVTVEVPMPALNLTDDQCATVFTPLTPDFNFMLCRQIVREIGEATNARACGITAQKAQQGIIVKIILPKEIWRNSKL